MNRSKRRMAVSLILTGCLLAVLAGVWILKVNRHRRFLSKEAQVTRPGPAREPEPEPEPGKAEPQKNPANARAAAEAENRATEAEKKSAEAVRKFREGLMRSLSPTVTFELHDIDSKDSAPPAEKGTGSNVFSIPPAAENVVLQLDATRVSDYPAYQVRILNRPGDVVWFGSELKRDGFGNFNLRLPAYVVPTGRYRVELFGGYRTAMTLLTTYSAQMRAERRRTEFR